MLHNLQYPFAHLITMLVRRLVGLHHVSRYSSLFTCLSPWRRRAQNLPCKSCSQQRHHIKTFCSLNITLILRQYRSFLRTRRRRRRWDRRRLKASESLIHFDSMVVPPMLPAKQSRRTQNVSMLSVSWQAIELFPMYSSFVSKLDRFIAAKTFP